MIGPGATYTYELTGNYGGWFSTGQETLAAVRSFAAKSLRTGGLLLVNLDLTSGDTLSEIVTTRFPYKAVVTVTVPPDSGGFAREADIQAIVKGAFWQAADDEPIVGSGQPAVPSILPSLSSVTGSLTTPLLLLALIVVGIAVIAWER